MQKADSPKDMSNGYDALAKDYIKLRSATGVGIIKDWAAPFPGTATILDVGCGNGLPVSKVIIARGLKLVGLDASPNMVAAFKQNFPDAEVICGPAETSDVFQRSFDGIIAVGLIFLLNPDSQAKVLRRMAGALKPEGRLLFTAPKQICSWTDILTEKPSASLGAKAYKDILKQEGLVVINEAVDEGGSHYYAARKA